MAKFRHELHAITAFKMFKDNVILGNGLYSFRYLCGEEKYIPKEKLRNKNYFIAPESGIFEKYDAGYNLI